MAAAGVEVEPGEVLVDLEGSREHLAARSVDNDEPMGGRACLADVGRPVDPNGPSTPVGDAVDARVPADINIREPNRVAVLAQRKEELAVAFGRLGLGALEVGPAGPGWRRSAAHPRQPAGCDSAATDTPSQAADRRSTGGCAGEGGSRPPTGSPGSAVAWPPSPATTHRPNCRTAAATDADRSRSQPAAAPRCRSGTAQRHPSWRTPGNAPGRPGSWRWS
jgi:hypothetical protein